MSENSKAYLELMKTRSVSINSARTKIKKTLANDTIIENPNERSKLKSDIGSRNQSPNNNSNNIIRVFSN